MYILTLNCRTYTVRYQARQIQLLVRSPDKIARPLGRRASLASNKVSVWYVGTGPALKPGEDVPDETARVPIERMINLNH